MLRPDLEFKVKGPEDGNGRSGQLTWLYANNVGKRKAKDVHIETNIPSSLVESRLWIEADIVKDIKELPPERPLCIGVVGDLGPCPLRNRRTGSLSIIGARTRCCTMKGTSWTFEDGPRRPHHFFFRFIHMK